MQSRQKNYASTMKHIPTCITACNYSKKNDVIKNFWINIILKRFIKGKLVGIDWSLLSSRSYTHCFSFIGAEIQRKINALKMKKIDNLFQTVPDTGFNHSL